MAGVEVYAEDRETPEPSEEIQVTMRPYPGSSATGTCRSVIET
jgi:hypothetical protein